jgi:hypothetical protein
MGKSVDIQRGMDLINKYIIKYVDDMIESGHEGYVEDIVIEGFELGYIDIGIKTFIEYFHIFVHLMETNYETCMLSLGYNRFLLRMMKKVIFNYKNIKLLTLQYGFNRYAIETYSNLSDSQIDKIFTYVHNYRDKYRDDFEYGKYGKDYFI